MNKCIVSVGVGGGYPRLESLMVASVKRTNPGLKVFSWNSTYPPNAPPHAALPYTFKAYAIAEAKAQGYDQVIWLDSAIICHHALDPFFRVMETDGYLFIENTDCRFHTYASEGILNLFGRTMNWAKTDAPYKDLTVGWMFGFNFTHPQGKLAWEDYWNALTVKKSAAYGTKDQTRRNDEVLLALVVNKHNLRTYSHRGLLEGRCVASMHSTPKTSMAYIENRPV